MSSRVLVKYKHINVLKQIKSAFGDDNEKNIKWRVWSSPFWTLFKKVTRKKLGKCLGLFINDEHASREASTI